MSIKKFFADKDNTITNAYKVDLRNRGTLANMGASDIMEVFSIYGQSDTSSVEKTRALVQFSTKDIKASRDSGQIPESGSVSFFLRLFNAEHNTTTPTDYTLSVMPILDTWSEGEGLDMETYNDLGASNWISSSINSKWAFEGGTYSDSVLSNLTHASTAHSYNQTLTTGREDLQVDITDLVESWIVDESSNSVAATATILLGSNPSSDRTQEIKLRSYSGFTREFIFSTSSLAVGDIVYVAAHASEISNSRDELLKQIVATNLFSATAVDANRINVSQVDKGIYGNTINEVGSSNLSASNFTGGLGVQNRGLMIKLSGSAESGTDQKSYYTKRFFAKNSQYFFKKPVLESRCEKIITDDRAQIHKSSSLLPSAENLSKVYLYNHASDGSYANLPSTGSNMLVSFHPQIGTSSVAVTGPNSTSDGMYVTSSREEEGVYAVEFAYSGDHSKLYDVWHKYIPYDTAQGTFTYTGTVADLNNGVKFTLIDTAGTSHIYTFDTSTDTHTVSGDNSSIGVQTAKSGTDVSIVTSQVNASINASDFFTSSVSGSVVTIKQKTSGTDGNRTSTQDAGNVGFSVTDLAILPSGVFTTLVTGSGFNVTPRQDYSFKRTPQYYFNITNLKSSYTNKERVTLRVHTKEKSQAVTVYTKATDQSRVSKIKDAYYEIKRVTDDLEIIPYTTGSAPRYSKLSYDMSGSFFDLDMSILEPNFLYEIGFLSKFGTNYIEQENKFRFRIEK